MAARRGTNDDALASIHRRQECPPSVGVSRAVVAVGQPAAGYVGLIRRTRSERGVSRALDEGELAFDSHGSIVGSGYWIAPRAQHNGLATRAAGLLSGWALRTAGMIRVEALLDPRNESSRRVAEKSGFRREGHLRLYLELDGEPTDALVYSLLREELQAHEARS